MVKHGLSRAAFAASAALLITAALVTAAPDPSRAQMPPDMPPPAVIVQQVEVQVIDERDEYIGQIEAIDSVDIRARVEGFLEKIEFRAGHHVEEGDLLFEIEAEIGRAPCR